MDAVSRNGRDRDHVCWCCCVPLTRGRPHPQFLTLRARDGTALYWWPALHDLRQEEPRLPCPRGGILADEMCVRHTTLPPLIPTAGALARPWKPFPASSSTHARTAQPTCSRPYPTRRRHPLTTRPWSLRALPQTLPRRALRPLHPSPLQPSAAQRRPSTAHPGDQPKSRVCP